MALSPPANTDIATRQDLAHLEKQFDAKLDAVIGIMNARFEHAQELTEARIGRWESRMESQMWRVVVGTGVGLYLLLAGTMVAGFRFLS